MHRRFSFVLVLIFMAPLIAEVLPGSTPLTMPGLFIVDLLIYGPGALLIRELVLRRGRGWASILLLGVAYGLIEEGLALQSLFQPTYASAALWGARLFGVNWVYSGLVVIWIHPVWSAAVPILLTDLLFPARRALPSLKRFGLIATCVWYALGVALLALFARTSTAYTVSPILSGIVVLIALAVVVVALFVLPRRQPQATIPCGILAPWRLLLISGLAATIALGVPALLWRVLPAITLFPFVLMPLLLPPALAALLLWKLRGWTRSSRWNDRHLLALGSAMLIAHTIVGGLLFSKNTMQGVIIGGMGLVMVILLMLLARHVRLRVAAAQPPEPDDQATSNRHLLDFPTR